MKICLLSAMVAMFDFVAHRPEEQGTLESFWNEIHDENMLLALRSYLCCTSAFSQPKSKPPVTYTESLVLSF
jgi:hypothetical protein